MTYVLVGLPEDETTDAMSVTDYVLEGRGLSKFAHIIRGYGVDDH